MIFNNMLIAVLGVTELWTHGLVRVACVLCHSMHLIGSSARAYRLGEGPPGLCRFCCFAISRIECQRVWLDLLAKLCLPQSRVRPGLQQAFQATEQEQANPGGEPDPEPTAWTRSASKQGTLRRWPPGITRNGTACGTPLPGFPFLPYPPCP